MRTSFILSLITLMAIGGIASPATASPLLETSSMVVSADESNSVNKVNKYRKILIGQSYSLTSYNGVAYSGSSASLSWTNHSQLSATICNTINARAPQVKEGYSRNIRSKNAMSTKMACTDSMLSSVENTFIKGLSEGMKVARTKATATKKETLHFRTKSGDVIVFTLEATFME